MLSHVRLCDPTDCSTPGFLIHHKLPEPVQTHVHRGSDAIEPSHSLVIPFYCLQSFPASGSFTLSQFFPSGGQSIGASALASVLPMNIRMDWFDLLAVQGTLRSLLQHHCSRASFLRHSIFFIFQLSHPYMTTGKTIALTRWTVVGKVMSLLFNMLSRLVIAFLPRSKCLLISWLWSPSAVILEPPKTKSLTVSIVSPTICHKVLRPDAVILVFWMLSFKPAFSFSYSLQEALQFLFAFCHKGRVICISEVNDVSWQSWFSRQSWFQLVSSSPAFLMMYSAYKLIKQGENIQPYCTPFPIRKQSIVPCPVLTVAY